MKTLILSLLIVLILVSVGYAAVGCTLNDPDRDIRRIFPQATNYKTEFITIEERGGEALAKEVQEKLGDTFDSLYESLDVPYAFYTVLKGKDIIGYVHGVNQKGMYGGMQLILATDPEGKIIDFYYQKLSSPESKKFRSDDFTKRFTGLSLADFYTRDFKSEIKDPSTDSKQDYEATLRGLKKNMILYDEFMLGHKFDKEFVTREVSDVYAK